MDSYFEKRDKPTVFLVLGKEVVVDSEPLATALSRLPKLRRCNKSKRFYNFAFKHITELIIVFDSTYIFI